MPGPDNVPIPDPILPLAFVAAMTKTLRLATGVVILPQRHPPYVAKEMATLDVLSNGRAMLGVGIGWLQEEFDAVGVPFKERGDAHRRVDPGDPLLVEEHAGAVPGQVLQVGRRGVAPQADAAARCPDHRRRPLRGRRAPRGAPRRRLLPGARRSATA